jgi:hypothetical protein
MSAARLLSAPQHVKHRFEGHDMHPLLMMELARERHAKLLADAERASLVRDARRAGLRRPRRARSLVASLWTHHHRPTSERSAAGTPPRRPADFTDLAERFAAPGSAEVEGDLRRFVEHEVPA